LELKNKREKKQNKKQHTNKQTNLAHQEEDCDCSLSFYCWTISSPIIDNREIEISQPERGAWTKNTKGDESDDRMATKRRQRVELYAARIRHSQNSRV
jgi:hypothetical protein